MRAAAAILALISLPTLCHAGTLTRENECSATFEGTITKDDVARFEAFVPPASCNNYRRLSLNSSGGDVASAMAIGRLVRMRDIETDTCKCESACVLVFVAGVERGSCSGKLLKFGLHRLYWTHQKPYLPAPEVQSQRKDLVQQVRSYLEEMNASPLLLPMMEAIPPDKMRYLTDREMQELGLNGRDPVYDERFVAREARTIGITSLEYRRRKAKADAVCSDLKPNDDLDCKAMTLWDVSLAQLRRASDIAREQCKNLTGAEQQDACVQAAMRRAKVEIRK